MSLESLRGGVYDLYPELVPGKDYFYGCDLSEDLLPSPGEEDEMWAIDDLYPEYMISSYGRVWSRRSGRVLEHHRSTNGYPYVMLTIDGRQKTERVHRMVCRNFIYNPSPDVFDVARHMDNDIDDCWYGNLRWGTHKDNTRDSIESGRFVFPSEEARERSKRRVSKPIEVRSIDGEFVKKYPSITEASRSLGVSLPSIFNQLSGKSKQQKGYTFRRLGDR